MYPIICLGVIGIFGCGLVYLYLSQRSWRNTLEMTLESECYLRLDYIEKRLESGCYSRLDYIEEKLEKILAYIEQDSKKFRVRKIYLSMSLHCQSVCLTGP